MADGTSTRRVLVLAAMPVEVKPFVRMLSLTKSSLGGSPVYVGSIARRADATPAGSDSGSGATGQDAPAAQVPKVEIVAAVTGIGPQRARQLSEALLGATQVGHVVMIGVAGALDPTLRIGDLVVPTEVWDADTSQRYHPVPVQSVATHGTLRTSGEMQTDPVVLAPDRERGVIALDMETAAVAAVCAEHDVAFSAFRSISDRVQDGIVDASTLAMTKEDGSASVWGALKIIAARPSMLRKLSKLARDVRTATEVAAGAGVRECQAIAAR